MNIPDALVQKLAKHLVDEFSAWLDIGDGRVIAHTALTAIALLALGRAQGIEEAARVCEEWTGQYRRPSIGEHYAALIRSLSPPGEAKP